MIPNNLLSFSLGSLLGKVISEIREYAHENTNFFVSDFFKNISRWTFKTGDKRPGMVVVLAIDGCESLTVLVNILLFVATSRESRAFLSWNPFQPWALLLTFHSEPIVDGLKWKGNKITPNNWWGKFTTRDAGSSFFSLPFNRDSNSMNTNHKY